ncbi:MAG: glycosyltransferase [Calothrix sp. FI2-JRJ7]|jgi:hypothetical protein|nr:glycosyltransferase [Calothrix sp. FI2-JRJ7]
MLLPQKRRIALISVDGDPAAEIGQEEAGGQNVYVLHVGQALAQLGWQVDMFTRRSCSNQLNQLNIVQHTPNCRTIRLKAGPEEFLGRDSLFDYLPEFIEEFLKFQVQEDYQYPIVHTNYWLSAWVGMQLKQFQPLIQVHTYHSLGAVKYRTISDISPIATARLEVEKACLETAERIIATSPQEQEHLRQLVSTRGNVEIIPCGTEVEHFGFVGRHFSRQQLWHSVALKLSKLYSQLNQAPSHSTITAYHRKTRHSEPKVIQLLAK